MGCENLLPSAKDLPGTVECGVRTVSSNEHGYNTCSHPFHFTAVPPVCLDLLHGVSLDLPCPKIMSWGCPVSVPPGSDHFEC